MRNAQRKNRRARSGAAAVEMALCLPVFLLVLFANVELGRGLIVQQVLVNGTRVGARACIVGGLSKPETQAVVQDYLTKNGITGVDIDVVPDPLTVEVGEPIQVLATVAYEDVSYVAPKFLAQRSLSASSTMRKERGN